jgi:hypothetical protein
MGNLLVGDLIAKARSFSSGKDWGAAMELLAPRLEELNTQQSEQILDSVDSLVDTFTEKYHNENNNNYLEILEINEITSVGCGKVLSTLAEHVSPWDNKLKERLIDIVDRFNQIKQFEKAHIAWEFLSVFPDLNPETQEKIFQMGMADHESVHNFFRQAYPECVSIKRADCNDKKRSEYDRLANNENEPEIIFYKDPHAPQSAYILFEYDPEENFRKRSEKETARLNIGPDAEDLGSQVADSLRPMQFFADHAERVISTICRYNGFNFIDRIYSLSPYLAEMMPPPWQAITDKISKLKIPDYEKSGSEERTSSDFSTMSRGEAEREGASIGSHLARSTTQGSVMSLPPEQGSVMWLPPDNVPLLMRAIAPCLIHMKEPDQQKRIVDLTDGLEGNDFANSVRYLAPYLSDLHPDILRSSQDKIDERICDLTGQQFIIATSEFKENITNRRSLISRLTEPEQLWLSLHAVGRSRQYDCLTATHCALQDEPGLLNELVRAAIASPFEIKKVECKNSQEEQEFDDLSEGKHVILSFEHNPQDTSEVFVCDAAGNSLYDKEGNIKTIEISCHDSGLGGLLKDQIKAPLPYRPEEKDDDSLSSIDQYSFGLIVENEDSRLQSIDQRSAQLIKFFTPHWKDITALNKTKIARFVCSITDNDEFEKTSNLLAEVGDLDPQLQNEIKSRANAQAPGTFSQIPQDNRSENESFSHLERTHSGQLRPLSREIGTPTSAHEQAPATEQGPSRGRFASTLQGALIKGMSRARRLGDKFTQGGGRHGKGSGSPVR